jgi:hypothetical protein
MSGFTFELTPPEAADRFRLLVDAAVVVSGALAPAVRARLESHAARMGVHPTDAERILAEAAADWRLDAEPPASEPPPQPADARAGDRAPPPEEPLTGAAALVQGALDGQCERARVAALARFDDLVHRMARALGRPEREATAATATVRQQLAEVRVRLPDGPVSLLSLMSGGGHVGRVVGDAERRAVRDAVIAPLGTPPSPEVAARLNPVLASHGIEALVPAIGEEYRPSRHAVVDTARDPTVRRERICAVRRPGFRRTGSGETEEKADVVLSR